jgi:pimeloyl-ACP methyl ester carboxylesterase
LEDWARNLEADHRVIRYDLPGFALTRADPTADYSDRRSSAVLLALRDRLGVARASIVGNSVGGRIAWTFAAQNPSRTDKLVLISPDGFASPGVEDGATSKAPLMMRRCHMSCDIMLAPGVRQAIVDRMNHGAGRPGPPAEGHPGSNLTDGAKRTE